MAGRVLNRRELRKQADHAEQAEGAPAEAGTEAAAPAKKKKPRAKPAAGPKIKRVRAKKAPSRMRARWGVFDASMKQVAIFDYNQRPAADEKLAEMLARKKGTFFIQIVKEPIVEPEEAVVAAVA